MNVSPKQLSAFLIDAGFLKEKELEALILEAQTQKTTLEAILLEKKVISEEELNKMYAYILGIPFVNLEKEIIPKEILQIIPEAIAKRNNIIAFQKNDRELRVAMLNTGDIQTIDFIKKKTGLRISPCLTSRASIETALKQYHKSLQAEFGDIINENSDKVKGSEDLEKIAQDLPIIKIVDTFLKHAILQSASDIHIEPDEKEVRVRYRIDGILHEAMTLPKQVLPGVVARIKVLANLKLDEHRVPQDGRFKIEEDNKKISFRVSILPVFDGEKIVMRILDESSKGLTLEKMGLWGTALERVHSGIHRPNGMILVTGPTGSGKTTTLYTMMDILNKPEVNISTVEDPVEYRMPGVNQTQIMPGVGMTFAAGLRSLLRQDPDIIMVGEIRDSETLSIAMNASMTGHLVLSTLHTNSAAATIARMLDMKAESFLVASTVHLIIAQRLVRRLCPECRQEIKLTKKQIEELEEALSFSELAEAKNQTDFDELKILKKTKNYIEATFYKAIGCRSCNNEGYKGRLGIYEVLEVTEEIQKAIGRNATAEEIEKIAKQEGMFSMLADGVIKALNGITTLEEVLRVTQE